MTSSPHPFPIECHLHRGGNREKVRDHRGGSPARRRYPAPGLQQLRSKNVANVWIRGVVSELAAKAHVALRNVLRALGAAVTAGIGWRLGNDAYDAVKKRIKKQAEEEEGDEDDGPGTELPHGPRRRSGRSR